MATTSTGEDTSHVPTSGYDDSWEEALNEVVLVDQLPSDAWAEGVCVRPNGDVIASRLDGPELYGIDLESASHVLKTEFDVIKPRLLLDFADAGASGVFNVCPMPGSKTEEYVVVTGFADLANVQFHSFILWRVTLGADGEASREKITDLADGRFCVGLEPVSDRCIIVADAGKGCLWQVDVANKSVSVLLEDAESMLPPTPADMFGVNRVRVSDTHIWWANTGSGQFWCAPIERIDDGHSIRITEPPHLVASGMGNSDGLVVTRDAKSAYLASYVTGNLWRIDIDPKTLNGQVRLLREDLVSPTAMDLIYRDTDDKPTLYILCCGATEQTELDEGSRGRWFTIANVDKSKLRIMVTVETSITYEYI